MFSSLLSLTLIYYLIYGVCRLHARVPLNPFLASLNVEVFSDVLPNRCMATWNMLVRNVDDVKM